MTNMLIYIHIYSIDNHFQFITIRSCTKTVTRAPPPPRGQIFSQFHAYFWKICQNHMLAPLQNANIANFVYYRKSRISDSVH